MGSKSFDCDCVYKESRPGLRRSPRVGRRGGSGLLQTRNHHMSVLKGSTANGSLDTNLGMPRYELALGSCPVTGALVIPTALRYFDGAAPPPTRPSLVHSSALVSDPLERALADRRGAPPRWLSGRGTVADQRLRSS